MSPPVGLINVGPTQVRFSRGGGRLLLLAVTPTTMARMIVLDGLDGVGKSTTATALFRLVCATGRKAVVLKPELMYYRSIGADPHKHGSYLGRLDFGIRGARIASQTVEHLEDSTVVICDRYVDSIIAVYSALNGTPAEHQIVPHPSVYRIPDVPILLKCSPATRLRRLQPRVALMSERKRRAAFDLSVMIENRIRRARDWIIVDNDQITVDAVAHLILGQLDQQEVSWCRRCSPSRTP